MWYLVKIGQAISEKKTFKDYMISYVYDWLSWGFMAQSTH